MSDLPYQVGQKVRFVPGMEHCHTTTAGGDFLWAWRHLEDRGPTRDYPGHRKGELVDDLQTAGKIHRRDDGRFHTGAGHPVEPSHPTCSWPAWIHAIFEDGTVSLTVLDPKSAKTLDRLEELTQDNAFIWHRIPDREVPHQPFFGIGHSLMGQPNPDAGKPIHPNAPGVPYDPTKKRLHSFHLVTD